MDDFTVAGKASEVKAYSDILQQQGPLFGYFPKPSKSYMIVKEQHYNNVVDVFMGSKVKVTSEGKRCLGAVIDSEAFKVSYGKSFVDDWIKQLQLLTIISESEPRNQNHNLHTQLLLVALNENLPIFSLPSSGELLQPLEDIMLRERMHPAIPSSEVWRTSNSTVL